MERIVKILQNKKQTIATMESCSGGFIVNAITNVEGASEVLKFSAVTYSNEYKIKMGVKKETIDKYSVYSLQVAKQMSLAISNYALADYGIGVTGKINRKDPNNLRGDDNVVFISIYNRQENNYITKKIILPTLKRKECKNIILDEIVNLLLEVLA